MVWTYHEGMETRRMIIKVYRSNTVEKDVKHRELDERVKSRNNWRKRVGRNCW